MGKAQRKKRFRRELEQLRRASSTQQEFYENIEEKYGIAVAESPLSRKPRRFPFPWARPPLIGELQHSPRMVQVRLQNQIRLTALRENWRRRRKYRMHQMLLNMPVRWLRRVDTVLFAVGVRR